MGYAGTVEVKRCAGEMGGRPAADGAHECCGPPALHAVKDTNSQRRLGEDTAIQYITRKTMRGGVSARRRG